MQPTKAKDIAAKMNMPGMESIVDFVFREAKAEWKRLGNLSIYIDSLGIFLYGRKRLQDFKKRIELVQGIRARGGKKFYTFVDSMTEEELKETSNKIDKLLKIYEEYVTEKKRIREANKSSQNNLEEH